MGHKLKKRAIAGLLLGFGGILGRPGDVAVAANGTWGVDASGTWSDTGNWLGGVVANGVGSTADFSLQDISTATRTVTLDSSRSLGTLLVGDTDGLFKYSLVSSGGSTLTFNNSGSGAVLTQSATSAGDTISIPIVLADDLTIGNAASNVTPTAVSFGITGGITGTGNLILNNTGSGQLLFQTGSVNHKGTITNNSSSGTGTMSISSNLGSNVTAVVQNSAGVGLGLGGSNSAFSGAISIQAGNMRVSGSGILNSNIALSLDSTGSLSIFNTTISVGSITGTGAISGSSGSANAILISGAGDNAFSGTITNGSSTISVVKLAAGNQTFAGALSYTGGTRVNNGSFTLDGNTGSMTANTLFATGGTFIYDNINSTGTKTQGLGNLSIGEGSSNGVGASTIKSIKGGADSATLSFTSLGAKSVVATGNFVIADGTNGVDNKIVLTGQSGQLGQGYYFNGGDLAYVNAAGAYVRAPAYGVGVDGDTGYVGQGSAGALLTAAKHNQVTSSIAGQSAVSVNSLKIAGAGNIDLALTGNLTLTPHGIIRTGGGSATITGGTIGTGASNVDLFVRTDTASDILTVQWGTSGRIIKSGDGMLVLTGSGGVASSVSIVGGSISVAENANLGSASSFNINNGGLQITGTFTNTRIITLANTGTIEVTGDNVFTQNGVISTNGNLTGNGWAGSLTKTGSGTLAFGATNTYTGLTTILDGTLRLGANNQIAAGGLTMNGPNAVFDMQTFSDSVGTVTLDGGATISTTGASVLTSTGGFELKNGTADVVLAGAVTLKKSTAGLVTLNEVNAYTGGTEVNAGTLELASGAALGTGTIRIAGEGTMRLVDDTASPTTVTKVADTATVIIEEGGELNLAFADSGSTETINTLVLGGTTFNNITFTFASGYTEGGAEFAGYFAGSTGGNLTVLPEPGCLALLAAGGMLAMRRRARKR